MMAKRKTKPTIEFVRSHNFEHLVLNGVIIDYADTLDPYIVLRCLVDEGIFDADVVLTDFIAEVGESWEDVDDMYYRYVATLDIKENIENE